MPAASTEKRARQRANKLLQTESAAEPAVPSVPPAQTAEITSLPTQPPDSVPVTTTLAADDKPALWAAPSPATFIISYTPLSMSYPEPANPSVKLETDTIRVTQEQLTDMLHQSYIHGSKHGWKENLSKAKECLQADYKKDMQEATVKFAEHEKHIHQEEFNHGIENGQDRCKAQLASVKERLEAMYKKRHFDALEGFAECSEEIRDVEFQHSFNEGRDTGIQEGIESHRSSQAHQADFGMQTEQLEVKPSLLFSEPLEPITVVSSISDQSEPSPELSVIFLSAPSSLYISLSDLPSILASPLSDPLHPSSPLTLQPDVMLFDWSDKPSDVPVLSTQPPISFSVPPITTFPRCDFSDLCLGVNPWRSLQHQKGRDRCRLIQPVPQHHCQWPMYTSNFYSNISRDHIPHTSNLKLPYQSPQILPAPLDWGADPQLLELSCVLRTLGWVRPSTLRP